MTKDSKIYIAGHTGLIGSAVLQKLQNMGFNNLVVRTHKELDLLNQALVSDFFEQEKPEYVFFCAAKVGGMVAQLQNRASFLYENLTMQNNVIHYAAKNNTKKLLYLGSICIYPEFVPLPIKEEYIFQGDLQYNNEPYAIAKISGLKLCEFYSIQYGVQFIPVMPVSVYGSNDNFDLETSHVQAAIFRKIYLAKLLHENRYDELLKDLNLKTIEEARIYLSKFGIDDKQVMLLGTGNTSREFLHCDDLARACIYLMQHKDFKDIAQNIDGKIRNSHVNIGTGEEIAIKNLAFMLQEMLDYKGQVSFESTSKNDGTLAKSIDLSKIHALGWRHKITLKEGLNMMYKDYVNGIYK